MDIGTIIGFIAGAVFTVVSIMLSGSLSQYVDPASIMITIGGTFSCALIGNPLSSTITALKAITITFKTNKLDAKAVIEQIISLANVARKEGILALEEAAQSMEDQFLKKGILLIVDGTDPELVKNILETELAYLDGRHKDIAGIWEYISSMGPAWGMIGTLIGLINMLGELNDPGALGPKMAVALITTFYGSMLANYICTPVANKLKAVSGEEMLLREVMIEGMLSIQAGENPRIIEEKLKAFLAPAIRDTIGEAAANAAEEKEAGA